MNGVARPNAAARSVLVFAGFLWLSVVRRLRRMGLP
jgi:hypothetical protein